MTIASVTRTAYQNDTIANAVAANANEDAIVLGVNTTIAKVNILDTDVTTLQGDVTTIESKSVSTSVSIATTTTASALGYAAIQMVSGGSFVIASGVTFTIDVPFTAPLAQVFSGSGSVVFSAGSVTEVYPEWWGANTIPGTTDMTAAIQAAVNAHSNVSLAPTTYGISARVTLPATDTHIIGNNGTIKIITGQTNVTMLYGNGCSFVTMQDVTIDGNTSNVSTGTDAVLVNLSYCPTVGARNIVVKNAKKGGFTFSYGSYFTFTGSKIYSCGGQALTSSNITKEVLISGNFVADCYGDGLQYNVNTNTNTTKVMIVDNIVDNIAYSSSLYSGNGLGITVNANDAGGDTSVMGDVVISNNVVTNCESMGLSLTIGNANATAYGRLTATGNTITNAGVGSSNTVGIGLELSGPNITATGNTITNADSVGISAWNLTNCTISGNTIFKDSNQTGSQQEAGIRLTVTTAAKSNKKVNISGNTIINSNSDTTTTGPAIGVYGITPNGIDDATRYENISINDNVITGNWSYGVAVLNKAKHVNVQNNNVDLSGGANTGGSAMLVSGNYLNVSGNTIVPKYGFVSLDLAVNVSETDNVMISNNIIDYPYYPAAGINFAKAISGSTPNVQLQNNKMIAGSGWGAAAISNRANCYTLIESNNDWNWGTATPTVGAQRVGCRHLNSAPAVGQPKSWVCTVAGTPGTWVSEGNL